MYHVMHITGNVMSLQCSLDAITCTMLCTSVSQSVPELYLVLPISACYLHHDTDLGLLPGKLKSIQNGRSRLQKGCPLDFNSQSWYYSITCRLEAITERCNVIFNMYSAYSFMVSSALERNLELNLLVHGVECTGEELGVELTRSWCRVHWRGTWSWTYSFMVNLELNLLVRGVECKLNFLVHGVECTGKELTRSWCRVHWRGTWSWTCTTCAADEQSVAVATASVRPASSHAIIITVLPSSRQRLSSDDWMEEQRQDYQNCSMPY